MYCLRCGTRLSDDARSCPNCGSTSFSAASPVRTAAAPPERDHAIPLKRKEVSEAPVQKDTAAAADRSIPVHRPEPVPTPKPERKAAETSQRAIAPPPAMQRAGKEPLPSVLVPAASAEPARETAPASGTVVHTQERRDTAIPYVRRKEDNIIPETVITPGTPAPTKPEVPSTASVSSLSQEPAVPNTEPVAVTAEGPSAIRTEDQSEIPAERPSLIQAEESADVPYESPAAAVAGIPAATAEKEISPASASETEDNGPAEIPEETSEAPASVPEKARSESNAEPASAPENAPGEAPVTETPAAAEDKKDKAAGIRKSYIAAAAAVVILLAGIWYAFRIWPQQQFEKFYTAGSEALEQLDFETAAEKLALAYRIKQDDPSLNEMLYKAYEGVYDLKLSEGDTEAAIAAGNGMVGLIPENDDDIKARLGRLYITYVRTLLLDGRTEKASRTVVSAADYLNEEDLAALQDLQNSFLQLSTFAETVAEMSDSGAHKDICTLIDEIKPSIISCSDTSSGRQPVVRVKGRSHEYVVFYRHSSGQYYVFYGDLTDEGKRQGSGTIYYDGRSTSKDMLYYYTSGWENDKPNGGFSEHEFTGTRYGTETIYEGTLKDGFFDGTIAITWGSSGVYFGEYTAGKVTVQDVDPETGRYIIAYNEAHDDFLSYPNDPSSSRFGVDFY